MYFHVREIRVSVKLALHYTFSLHRNITPAAAPPTIAFAHMDIHKVPVNLHTTITLSQVVSRSSPGVQEKAAS